MSLENNGTQGEYRPGNVWGSFPSPQDSATPTPCTRPITPRKTDIEQKQVIIEKE
jgi:hypothetical protein